MVAALYEGLKILSYASLFNVEAVIGPTLASCYARR